MFIYVVLPSIRGENFIEYFIRINKDDEKRKAIRDLQKRFQDIKNSDGTKAISLLVFVIFSLVFAVQSLFWPIGYLLKILIAIDTKKSGGKKSG
jgi:hypothetical protein